MARNSKNATSVVAINKVTQTIFGLSENEVFEHDFSKSNRAKETYISYVPYKDVMTTTVEISKTVADDDLLDTIVVKVYEELGLDTALDYKITYSEVIGANSDDRVFNVFVVDNTKLTAEFDAIAARTNYIDYVAMAPFLYENLYARGILTRDGIDCFVYLQRDDAFLVVYQNGEYFQSRQLRYNLKFLHDKFSELVGNRMEEAEFFKLLATQGINLENPAERDYMIQIFDDMFYYINDVLNGISKVYNINIQSIYIGTDIGKIPAIEVFVENNLKIDYKDFNFSVAINAKDYPLTQLDTLMFLAGQQYLAEPDDDHNYSPFMRPPPLNQRYSGKLIGYILGGLLLGAAYPAYQFGYGYYNNMIADEKTVEYEGLESELVPARAQVKEARDKTAKVKEEFGVRNKELGDRSSLINEIFSKKNEYAMKGMSVFDLTNMIVKNRGKLVRIGNDDRNITVEVHTKNDKQMTELLEDISQKAKYGVYTETIVLQGKDDSVVYDSNISVEVR
ncbi:hypothetical protein OFN97_01685 [Campylobacter sp. VBCF_05 NA6]|uniref:hypothetical protein n=1 Tax=unclassified Campylobacter TaxID=2593542 RepID=UPI0022E9B316|nr:MULTISPECIES: hypothetical protein [unclassified Campylobacter]MDA3056964.1 hypothetical protein [Campylobacter sp. VBCF_04 NA7]MDA3058733.1 hypothetical protein [Campylobacter sp. VBCF_05 NA6]